MTITSSVPTQPCKLVHVRASASFSPFLSFNVLLATAPGDSLSCSYDQLANPYHVLAMEVTMCPSKAKLDVESFFRGCLHRVSWYISFFFYIYIYFPRVFKHVYARTAALYVPITLQAC